MKKIILLLFFIFIPSVIATPFIILNNSLSYSLADVIPFVKLGFDNSTNIDVNNSNFLDSLDSTQFLRSDQSDTINGNLTAESSNTNYGGSFRSCVDASAECYEIKTYAPQNALTWTGNWIPFLNNVQDIGNVNFKPRDIKIGRDIFWVRNLISTTGKIGAINYTVYSNIGFIFDTVQDMWFGKFKESSLSGTGIFFDVTNSKISLLRYLNRGLFNATLTGDLEIVRNITTSSPDGTRWNCGVNNSGDFSCT